MHCLPRSLALGSERHPIGDAGAIALAHSILPGSHSIFLLWSHPFGSQNFNSFKSFASVHEMFDSTLAYQKVGVFTTNLGIP